MEKDEATGRVKEAGRGSGVQTSVRPAGLLEPGPPAG
jgi:hypothetical protein